MVSIIVPAKDEEKSVKILYEKISGIFSKIKKSFEIVFVDDGSTDSTFEILKKIHNKDKRVQVVRLRGNFGKSIALSTGFSQAMGDIVITMDADLQDDPNDIPKFLTEIEKGYDLVSGWKKARHDPLSKTLPSKFGNFLTRVTTGVKIHDLNCGFKAYKKEVIDNISLYGELYKFIPVLASKLNFRIGEVVVSHHARAYGKSKYGAERNLKGFLDLLTVIFITKYVTRPGHFFGGIGAVSFAAGFVIGLYISYLRLTTGSIQYRQPLLFLGILLMIIGIQLVTTGLLAEMVAHSQKRDNYEEAIKEKLVYP